LKSPGITINPAKSTFNPTQKAKSQHDQIQAKLKEDVKAKQWSVISLPVTLMPAEEHSPIKPYTSALQLFRFWSCAGLC